MGFWRKFDIPGSASGGDNWDWAGNYNESSRGDKSSTFYGPNNDSNGAFKEEGSRTNVIEEFGEVRIETESWVYYYDESRIFLGGYEIDAMTVYE